jgi:hypothetical protein
VYKWTTKTSQAAIAAYCLIMPQSIIGVNEFLHNRMSIHDQKTIEVAQKIICTSIAIAFTEIADYFIGDWFECDKE